MDKNTSEIQIRVRYAETDRMGFVYYGNYATYFEVARVEWLRERGLSYKKMEDSGLLLPVVHMSIDYKRPGLYDDLLTIKVELTERPRTKLTFRQTTYNEKGEMLNQGTVVLVCINSQNQKPIRFPEELSDKIFTD